MLGLLSPGLELAILPILRKKEQPQGWEQTEKKALREMTHFVLLFYVFLWLLSMYDKILSFHY